MKKFTSILLAVMILISCSSATSVFAKTTEEVTEDYALGEVIVKLVMDAPEIEELLPGFEIESVDYLLETAIIDTNTQAPQELSYAVLVKFKEKTTDIVWKAIEALKDSPYVISAEPRYYEQNLPVDPTEEPTQTTEKNCLKIIQNKYGKDVTKCEIFGTLGDYKVCFAGAAPDGDYIFTALYYWKSLGNYTFISFAQACPYDLGVFVVDSENAYTLDDAYNNEIINDDDLKYIVEDVFCNSSYCWSAYASGADIAPISPQPTSTEATESVETTAPYTTKSPEPIETVEPVQTESNENSSQTEATSENTTDTTKLATTETTENNTETVPTDVIDSTDATESATTEPVTVEVTENNTVTVPTNVTDSTDATEPETIGTTDPPETVPDDKPALSAPKTTITLAKSSATLYLKDKIKIKANVKNSTEKTTYTSSDTKVAVVDSKGNVKAKKAGKAVITVTNNGVTKKFTVNVKNPKLNKNTVTVKKKGTVTVKIIGKIKEINNTYINTKRAKITSKKSASTLTIKGMKKGDTTLKINVSGITLKLKVKVK